MMLPLAASVLFMLRRSWLWTGVLIVVAGAFRQSAAVNLLLVGLAIYWLEPAPRQTRAALMFAGGLLVALIAGALLIALTGSLAGFWLWSNQSLLGPASNRVQPTSLWRRASGSI